MRFLHLADLHLGKVLHKQNLLADQKYIFSRFCKFLRRMQWTLP